MRTLAPHRVLPAVLVLLAVCSSATPVVARQWTDATGKFKIDAEVLSYDGNTVTFKLTDGSKFPVPVAKLSEPDIAFLKKTYPDGLAGKPMKTKSGKLAGMKAEVVSLSIVKPSSVQLADDVGPGTHLRLVITDPARNVVGLDPAQSKIVSCKDDKGTNLAGDSAGAAELTLEVAPDGKSGVIDLHQPQVPGAKATKIQLKGELYVVCGIGEGAETIKLPLNLVVGLGL